jgi:hypothetical protein
MRIVTVSGLIGSRNMIEERVMLILRAFNKMIRVSGPKMIRVSGLETTFLG